MIGWLEVIVYWGGRGARLMVGSCLFLYPTVPRGFGEFGSCFSEHRSQLRSWIKAHLSFKLDRKPEG